MHIPPFGKLVQPSFFISSAMGIIKSGLTKNKNPNTCLYLGFMNIHTGLLLVRVSVVSFVF
jgi:hypothetical protein